MAYFNQQNHNKLAIIQRWGGKRKYKANIPYASWAGTNQYCFKWIKQEIEIEAIFLKLQKWPPQNSIFSSTKQTLLPAQLLLSVSPTVRLCEQKGQHKGSIEIGAITESHILSYVSWINSPPKKHFTLNSTSNIPCKKYRDWK